jgi:hypothetical protein
MLLKTPSGHEAHHIVPWAKTNHSVIQKAADAGDPIVFHPNEVFNGISLPISRHHGDHSAYSTAITNRLNQWEIANPNASPQQAASSIRQWLQGLKAQIENTTAQINDIVPPPIPNP